MFSLQSFIILTLGLIHTVSAQSSCNPLNSTCPSVPALGKSILYDFTKVISTDFVVSDDLDPITNSSGKVSSPVALLLPNHYLRNICCQYVSVTLKTPVLSFVTQWYMMFGHIKVVMAPAPGRGVATSLGLESIDLDAIYLDWVGLELGTVQTDYIGKGNMSIPNRHVNIPIPANNTFTTYEVEWTAEKLDWIVNGSIVRSLSPATADFNHYPQTPMHLEISSWAVDDTYSAEDIAWAGGMVDWSKSPFYMVVKSIEATDYSTGNSYSYADRSGNWQSIRSDGGKINGNVHVLSNASTTTTTSTGIVMPSATTSNVSLSLKDF